jgi:hypothetical protein
VFYVLVCRVLQLLHSRPLQASLVALALVGSCTHAFSYKGDQKTESVAELKGHLEDPHENWYGVGAVLGALFGDAPGSVTIALTAAGAIPYISKLNSVDMLGVNDRWVARNGIPLVALKPGHVRYAPVRYLVQRKVNLVIGHPRVVPLAAPSLLDPRSFLGPEDHRTALPQFTRVLEVPVGEGYKLQMLYVRPHPAIDGAVRKYGLHVRKLLPQP